MNFDGWTDDDFAVFEIEGFEARMPVLKARLTPKLKEIGERLAPQLKEQIGLPLYPKVAQHLRRRVNAPPETWVAFSRNTRGYKPYVHLRVAINAEAAKIVCHVDDGADDLETFGRNLEKNAREMAAYFAEHPEIRCHNVRGEAGEPASGGTLNKRAIEGLVERIPTLRGEHLHFAIHHPSSEATRMSADVFLRKAVEGMEALMPLYRLGL